NRFRARKVRSTEPIAKSSRCSPATSPPTAATCGHRKFRAPQPKRMPAVRIQMHCHENPRFFERHIAAQRVLHTIRIVILILKQKRRRHLVTQITTNSAADATRWVEYSRYSLPATVEAIFNLGTL